VRVTQQVGDDGDHQRPRVVGRLHHLEKKEKMVALRPHTPKANIRGGWSHYTDTSEVKY
jgi:hypothetical protein